MSATDKEVFGATATVSSSNTTFSHCSEVINTGNIFATGNVNITQKVTGQNVLDKKAQRINERTLKRIKSWTANMVKTAAFENLMKKLNAGASWITIIGSPGEGKTTTAYMALEEFHKQGRQVFQLWSPEEYVDVTLSSSCPVILLDDIFGDVDYDQAKLEMWKPVLHQILDEKEHSQHVVQEEFDINRLVVIIVGREYILKCATRFFGKMSRFFTLKEIDMSHPVLRSHEEKVNIWKAVVKTGATSLTESEISELCKIDSGHGFPHVCRMFATLHTEWDNMSAVKFFKAPLQFLNETIKALMENEKNMTLFKEMITKNGEVTSLQLRNTDNSYKLLKAADYLVGTYLRKEGDDFMFNHPSIYDSVAYNICTIDPLFAIQNCDVAFIHQRLRLIQPSHQEQDHTNTDMNLVVKVPLSFTKQLAERFATEISNANLFHVLSHAACSDKAFVEHMMSNVSIPLIDLLQLKDTKTDLLFLELIPSNKSAELLKYIDSMTDFIKENNISIQIVVIGVCKYAASDVLLYMKDKYGDKIDMVFSYGLHLKSPLMFAAETGDHKFVDLFITFKPQMHVMDKRGTTVFHYLCEYGHVSAVQKAIDSGIDIRLKDRWNDSPLDSAIMGNHVDVVRLLLDKKVRNRLLGAIDFSKAMYTATKYCDEEMVSILTDSGASVNKADGHASTPLHELCERDKFKAVTLLLDKGADVNGQNENGFTPVYCAVTGGYAERTEMLIKAGADVNIPNKNGSTPLHEAAGKGYADCVGLLLRKQAAVNVQNKYGFTPLHWAAIGGHKKCVEMLAKAGADLNVKSRCGFTPFYRTADGKFAEQEYVFVEPRNDVNIQKRYGFTPLHEAANRGYTNCVDVLIMAGADVNVQNKYGCTPVHEAADNGNVECLNVLIKAGAHVHHGNKCGTTPLHKAAVKGSKECLDVLIKAGVSVNVQNKYASSPLHEATDKGFTECTDVLIKAGANVNVQNKYGFTPLHKAAHNKHTNCLISLIKSGADVNSQNKYGCTPLHRAADCGSTECIDILSKDGADVNIQDKNGSTALHRAANRGFAECMQVLMKKGATVTVQDAGGYTPLHGAVRIQSLECTQLLLKCGASVNTADKQGHIPLHHAVYDPSKPLFEPMMDLCKVLLEWKSNVNQQDTEGNTPLHLLCKLEQKVMEFDKQPPVVRQYIALCDKVIPMFVRLLLDHKADVNLLNSLGDPPLQKQK